MIRIILGAIIGAMIFASVAKAEDKAPTVKETVTAVTEWVNDIPNKPAKIQAWAQAEWQETKEFQAKGWADGKAQLNRSWTQIKGLFSNTKSTN